MGLERQRQLGEEARSGISRGFDSGVRLVECQWVAAGCRRLLRDALLNVVVSGAGWWQGRGTIHLNLLDFVEFLAAAEDAGLGHFFFAHGWEGWADDER